MSRMNAIPACTPELAAAPKKDRILPRHVALALVIKAAAVRAVLEKWLKEGEASTPARAPSKLLTFEEGTKELRGGPRDSAPGARAADEGGHRLEVAGHGGVRVWEGLA